MAIESSGTISLGTTAGTNRSISGEFGGSTPHALSEYYRGGSEVPNTSANNDVPTSSTIKFSDFYDSVNFAATGNEAIGSWPVVFGSITHPGNNTNSNGFNNQAFTNANFAEVIATIDFYVDESNNRVEIRYFGSNSSAASSYTVVYLTYVDLDISQSSVWQVKADWNYSTSVGAGAAAGTIVEPAANLDNAYRTLSASSRTSYTWKVTSNSGNETATIGSGVGDSVTFYLKNTDGTGTAREVNSGSKTLFLKATRGTQQEIGGGGGGGV